METKQETYRCGIYYLTLNRQGYWCRTWYDEQTRQRKSSSLGVRDVQLAKKALTEWFVLNESPTLDEDLELSRCLIEYWKQHAKHLKRADAEKRNSKYWLEYFPGKLVKEIRPPHQREFIKHLADKGYAKGTIESIFKTGSAAINFAWKNDMLLNPVPLLSVIKEVAKTQAKTTKRWRYLEVDEIAALFDGAKTDRLVRFLIILVGTGCRPAAALELEGVQINRKDGTINFLADGEEQTNKYRPEVRLPSFVRSIYHKENICEQGPTRLKGKDATDSIRTSFRSARTRAGLDELANPYSFRHTVARWLRKSAVGSWHTSSQMGHKKKGAEITEVYASSDPEYLDGALKAIEELFAEIYKKSTRLQKFDGLNFYRNESQRNKDKQP